MSEIAKYLRFLINADKEAKISIVSVTETPTQFETQLSLGQTRRRIGIYNNSESGSGECFFSFKAAASPSGEGMIIPKGKINYLPIADEDTGDISLYFFCEQGEVGNLQVMELS